MLFTRFEKLTVPEKVYPYIKATAGVGFENGAFGTLSEGMFAPGAGNYVVMQIEKGDNAKVDEYMVNRYEEVRVADLNREDVQGLILDVCYPLAPASSVSVGDMLAPGNDGALAATDGTTGYKVVEICPWGLRVEIATVAQG